MKRTLMIAASGEKHGRAVKEWIGKTPDSKPPQLVIDRVLLRQNRIDPITERVIRPGDKTACDHIKPLWKGGKNRESNLQIILVPTHDAKTKKEAGERAKEQRVRMKHLGLKRPTSRPIAGSKASPWKHKLNGQVERRS